MNRTDLRDDSVFIILCKGDFKDPERFDDYCKFLQLHGDSGRINVPVDVARIKARNAVYAEAKEARP